MLRDPASICSSVSPQTQGILITPLKLSKRSQGPRGQSYLQNQPGEGFLLLEFPLKVSLLLKAFFQPGLRQYKKKKKGGGFAKENTTAYFTVLQLYL